MKKTLLFALCSAMAVSSCTKDELEVQNRTSEGEKLTFGQSVVMESRAIDKASFVNGDKILVNACLTEKETLGGNFTNNFMSNVPVTKVENGYWSYEVAKFWPKNWSSRISFVANYPSSVEPKISQGICSFYYKVNLDPALQEDFMWASITDAYSGDRNGTYQNGIYENPATKPSVNVDFRFKHALSKIVFRAKASKYYDGARINITDVNVYNLYSTGVYSLTEKLSKGSWMVTGYPYYNYTVLDGSEVVELSSSSYKTLGHSLLTIPQTMATEGEFIPTVTIRYTVSYPAPEQTVVEERTFPLVHKNLPNGNTWEQDMVYYYDFNIDLDMITFDATIDKWGGSSNQEIVVQ